MAAISPRTPLWTTSSRSVARSAGRPPRRRSLLRPIRRTNGNHSTMDSSRVGGGTSPDRSGADEIWFGRLFSMYGGFTNPRRPCVSPRYNPMATGRSRSVTGRLPPFLEEMTGNVTGWMHRREVANRSVSAHLRMVGARSLAFIKCARNSFTSYPFCGVSSLFRCLLMQRPFQHRRANKALGRKCRATLL